MQIRTSWLAIFGSAMIILAGKAYAFSLNCDDRIAIVPVYSENLDKSSYLADQAKSALLQNQDVNCDVFIPMSKTDGFFDLIGLNPYYSKNLEDLPQERIRLIHAATQARYLLQAKLTDDKTLAVKLYPTAANAEETVQAVYRIEAPIPRETLAINTTHALLQKLVRASPNSLSLGLSRTSLHLDFDKGYRIIDQTQKETLPKLLTSFSYGHVDHPSIYTKDIEGKWDLSASFFGFAVEQITRVRKDLPTPGEEPVRTLFMKLYGGCAHGVAGGEVHLSLGTFYAGGGFGPCVYQLGTDEHQTIYNLAMSARSFFGYRVFISDRVFATLEVDATFFMRDLYRSDIGHDNEVSRALLTLGWYVPNADRTYLDAVRKLL